MPLGTPQQQPSPLTGTTAGLLASPNWQDQISGYLAGQAGAPIAQSDLTGALGSAQLGMTGSQLGVGQAEAGVNQGFDLANALLGMEGVGLEGQGLGIQRQGLAGQQRTAAQQQGIEQSIYGVQSGQYPEQQAEAALQNFNAQEDLSSSGASSGTLQTAGHKRAVGTQATEYGWQQADIFRNQQLAALGQQSEEVGYAGQQQQLGTQGAQLGNQQQQLELAAKGQGLSAAQAQAQLGFGLQQLGYQSSPEQYLQSIANAQGGAATQLSALGSQASLIGGLGPNFLG